jgi:hypothetical protein
MPVYITVCSSGNLCYSDYVSLYCIKPDGEEVFAYNSPDTNMLVFDAATPPDCDPVICIFLHTFFLTISINVILSLLLEDTTTILVPGIVVISYGLYLNRAIQ